MIFPRQCEWQNWLLWIHSMAATGLNSARSSTSLNKISIPLLVASSLNLWMKNSLCMKEMFLYSLFLAPNSVFSAWSIVLPVFKHSSKFLLVIRCILCLGLLSWPFKVQLHFFQSGSPSGIHLFYFIFKKNLQPNCSLISCPLPITPVLVKTSNGQSAECTGLPKAFSKPLLAQRLELQSILNMFPQRLIINE